MKRYDIVKAELWQDRMDFAVGRPRCDVCGEPLSFSCDVHHAIVRRGHMRRAWDKELIDHPVNLCLVHRGCHNIAHASPVSLVAVQVVRYGFETVKLWVESLPFKVFFCWHRGMNEDRSRLFIEERKPWIRGVQE